MGEQRRKSEHIMEGTECNRPENRIVSMSWGWKWDKNIKNLECQATLFNLMLKKCRSEDVQEA